METKLKTTFLLIIAAILSVGAAVIYTMAKQPVSIAEPVVCTLEAKLCPDGSYVGRTGPDCEFAACP
jgi:hypothetical protein